MMGKRFILVAALLLSGLGSELRAISLDNWTAGTANTSANILGVQYAQGLWVAVGDQGTILTSNDGSNWGQQDSRTSKRLRAVTYGNGQFLAVGGNGAPFEVSRLVLTSRDGTNWSTLYDVTGEASFAGVVYAKGQFVAVASGFTSDILSSADGTNWTLRATVAGVMGGVTYATNTFVAAGNTIQTSPDGINWTQRLTADQSLRGITYGRGKFIAVGDGTPSLFLSSNDGTNWSGTTPVLVGNLKSISYGNGYYVAVGSGGSMVSSIDGNNWTNRNSGTSAFLRFVTPGLTCFVTVGDGGAIRQSGITLPQIMNAPQSFSGFHQMLIDADPGRAYALERSTDFVNWLKIFTLEPTAQLTSIAVSTDGYPHQFFRVSTP